MGDDFLAGVEQGVDEDVLDVEHAQGLASAVDEVDAFRLLKVLFVDDCCDALGAIARVAGAHLVHGCVGAFFASEISEFVRII